MRAMPIPPNDYDLLPVLLDRCDSIASKIGPATPSGCWPWVGSIGHAGYSTMSLKLPSWTGHRSVRGHRAVFMLHHQRPIARGMTLHHTCHNPPCVNPAHLVEMTQGDNAAADATGGGSIRFREGKLVGPRWAVLFREAGLQRSKTFGSLDDAEHFLATRKAAALASCRPAPEPTDG